MTQDTYTPQPNPAAEGVEFISYWGVSETHRFPLANGQYFEIRPMDEGAKSKFQKLTNRGLRMNQRTNDAHWDVDPANERHVLIYESVIAWNIFQPDRNDPRGYSEYPCPNEGTQQFKRALEQMIEKFDPKTVQDLEFFIRQKNPWMQSEMTVEQIDEQISDLQKLREEAKKREAGEDSSATK